MTVAAEGGFGAKSSRRFIVEEAGFRHFLIIEEVGRRSAFRQQWLSQVVEPDQTIHEQISNYILQSVLGI